jgi:hypothetical protein
MAVANFQALAVRESIVSPAAHRDSGTPAGAFTAASGGLSPLSPPPASSFLALDSDGLRHPPDTMGAVGPNHVMTLLNSSARIQDRTGNGLSTLTLSNFWGAVGPFEVDATQREHYGTVTWVFDPRLFYDAQQQRWIACSLADGPQPGESLLLIGVSRTSDPTGDWYQYRIDVDPARQSWMDFPMLGFNKDWIVVNGVFFRVSDDAFVDSRVYVFNKTNLYAGGAGLFTLFRFGTGLNYLQMPSTAYDDESDTIYLARVVGEGNNRTSLQLHSISGPVGAERYATNATVTITNAWDDYPPSGRHSNFLPQRDNTNRLFFTASFMVGGLCLRNGALWMVHHVCLPAGGASRRSAIQWWQLSTNGTVLQRGLIDDPAGEWFYAYPSIAVNRFNDVLIGYSRSSSNEYVGAYYSYRANSDPPNTMRADRLLKAGEAPYYWPRPNGRNRWGDYSQTVVDPVNDTDFWTIQEYAMTRGAINAAGTDSRWGTWWGRVVPPGDVSITGVAVGETAIGTTQAVLRVSLSRSNTLPVSVDFAASDGTALGGCDYLPVGGTVVFAPGETNQTFAVPLLDDSMDESNEVFFVNLSNPTNTTLAFSRASVTILDNDPPPSLTIDDVTVREGDMGFTDTTFTFSLSALSGWPVSFRAVTANGGATLRVDYVPTNITVTIPAGTLQRTHTVQIIGDTLIETNETFFLNLSSSTNVTIARNRGTATIVDDDFKVIAVELVGGDVRLTFTTEAGKNYRVERATSLNPLVVWEPVPGTENLPGTGAVMQAIDSGAAVQSQRFYRITRL